MNDVNAAQVPEGSSVPENDAEGGTDGPRPSDKLSERAAVARTVDGQIDVLKTVGGYQGLAESIVPALIFSVVFTLTRGLSISLAAAVVSAAIFTVVRLVQKTPLTQALAGIIGVAICAFVAMRTGDAQNYFLPGFITNAVYIVVMLVSLLVRWPVAGLLFGFIRSEGTTWRRNEIRRRSYALATWIIIAVLALRLAVQLPLFLADNFVALATARLIMGLPLYALGLWIAWLVSRPRAAVEAMDA